MLQSNRPKQNSTQNKKFSCNSSSNMSTLPEPIFINLSEQQLEKRRLLKRVNDYKRFNSIQLSVEYEGQKRKENFQDDLFSFLKNDNSQNNIPIKQMNSGYNVQKYLHSIQHSLKSTAGSIRNFQSSLAESTMESTHQQFRNRSKRQKDLQKIINDFGYNFIKYSFRQYYELHVNLKAIFTQQFDQVKEFEPLLPDMIQFLQDSEIRRIPKTKIMFPPPYHNNDYFYIHEKSMFKLSDIKQSNIYKTPKSKNLIFLKIRIIDLVNFFAKFLPEIFLNTVNEPFESYKHILLYLFDKKICTGTFLQQFKSIFNINFAYVNYEVQALLIYMAQKIKEQLQQKLKFQKIMNQDVIKKICEERLNKFVEWILFYNFTICCYEHYHNKPLSIRNYVSEKKNESGFTDMKIRFFKETFTDPKLLKRIFRQSIALDNHASIMLQRLNKQEYSIQSFYLQFHRVAEEEEAIINIIKYRTHFYQYYIEVILELSESKNMSLDYTHNCVRFLLMFCISTFAQKAMKRINRQIKFCYGSFIASRIEYKNEDNTRHKEAEEKLNCFIQKSYAKIQGYIQSIETDKKNLNVIKMSQFVTQGKSQIVGTNIVQLVNSVYASYKNRNQFLSVAEEQKQMHSLYQWTIILLSREYLTSKHLEKSFKRLIDKHLKTQDIKYDHFLNNQPIFIPQTINKNKQEFKQRMQAFQKDFKLCTIEMIKIYLMVTTLWCYSWDIEQKYYLNKSSKIIEDKYKFPKDYKQMLSKIDMFYIHNGHRITSYQLKEKSIDQITKVYQNLIQFTRHVNFFFIGLKKAQNSKIINDILFLSKESFRDCVVPVGIEVFQQNAEQQIQWGNTSLTQFLSENNPFEKDKKCLKILDLNKIVNRKIQKNKVSIFGTEDSHKIAKLIVDIFNLQNDRYLMSKNNLEKIQNLTYRYTYSQIKQSEKTSASTKSSSVPSIAPY